MFNGKVIVVTGASRGIGAAVARGFAKEGALVVVNYYQSEAAAADVVRECQSLGGDAWAIRADVTSAEAVREMINEVELEAGRIDVLVNNAFASYSFDPERRKLFFRIALGGLSGANKRYASFDPSFMSASRRNDEKTRWRPGCECSEQPRGKANCPLS